MKCAGCQHEFENCEDCTTEGGDFLPQTYYGDEPA